MHRKLLVAACMIAGCFGAANFGTAVAAPVPQDNAATPPDNSKVNRAPANSTGVTADKSKNDKSDLEIARRIRRSIVTDKNLSTYAHNVKVVVRHGSVTLKGPVRSDDEKSSIESKATEVAGSGNVRNELTVKPKK